MARRKRSKAAPPKPRTRDAAPCVVLAIDPGATAGWALFIAGQLKDVGVARKARERQAVVRIARGIETGEHIAAMPEHHGTPYAEHKVAPRLPLVVVAEAWEAGGWKSHTALIGTGAQWGRWQEQLEMAGHPARRIVRVTPQRWRSLVLKARTKEAAMAYCAARWSAFTFATADAAEAACIGAWATHAGEVGDVVPRTRRRRGADGGSGGA